MTDTIAAQRRLVAAGFAWFALMGLAVTMTGPLSTALAPMMGQPQSSEAQIGTALFAGAGVMILLNVLFAERFAGAWVARFCGISYTVGILSCWLSPNWSVLLLGFVFVGAGNGGMSIWYNAEFARFFDGPRVGAWLTALNGFWAVGAVSGPFLVGQFVAYPKRALLAAAILAVLALPMALRVPSRHHQVGDVSEESVRVPTRVYGLMVMLGFYVGAEAATLTLMSRHLMSVHEMTLALAAQVASCLWFAFMVGRFGAGPIAARVHPSRLLAGCAFLACLSLFLVTKPNLEWFGYVLLGLAMGPIFPAVIAWGTSLSAAAHRVTSLMILGPCVTAVSFPGLLAMLIGTNHAIMPWIIMGFHGTIATLAVLWSPRSAPATG